VKTDCPSKSYANLSDDRARMGEFFLLRRSILCNNPPDLIAVWLYSYTATKIKIQIS